MAQLKKKQSIKIVQWNARSIVSNKHSFSNFLLSEKVDIALISETWLMPNLKLNFPGYNIIRKDRPTGKGGVAIIIASAFIFHELKINKNPNEPELCGAKVLINNKWYFFLSIYRPPTISISSTEWINIFSSHSNLIIGGDFNAHHGLWGSDFSNKEGAKLANAIDSTNLIVLNNGLSTRLVSPNVRKSCVDVTLASPNLSPLLDWNLSQDTLGSDHFPIIMQLQVDSADEAHIIYPSQKWRLGTADWELFNRHLENHFIEQHIFTDIDEKVTYFINSLNSAASISIKQNKPFIPKKRDKPVWWDNECDAMISARKLALYTYKSLANEHNFIECNKIIAQAKRLFKKKAKKHWEGFCNNINKDTPTSKIWKQVKRLKNKNNSKTIMPKELIEHALDNLTPPNADYDYNSNFSDEHHEDTFLSRKFSLQELDKILKKGANTSPGPDDISYPMLRNMGVLAKMFLLDIYNDMWLNSYVPKCLKQSNVILFHKFGKDPLLCESYRPISLMSCITKTFERLIKLRLEYWLLNKNILPHNQYGFKPGFGTTDAMVHLVTDIQTALTKNECTGALFVDIKNAYENVNLSILSHKLIYLKIPWHIVKTIINLFTLRYISIKL